MEQQIILYNYLTIPWMWPPHRMPVVNEGLVRDSLLLLLCHSQTIPSIVHHSSAFYVIFYVILYFFTFLYTTFHSNQEFSPWNFQWDPKTSQKAGRFLLGEK